MTQSDAFLFDPEAVFHVEDYLYFYSESLTDERTEAEVSALVDLLELQTPMAILDLACGYGRHANRLAAMGHKLTGIDLMPGFIDLARQDAQRRGVVVDYRQGDMRAITFDHAFDRVMILFTAFGYFEDEGNLTVLKKAAQALKPGGLLCLDVPNRDMTLKTLLPYRVTEKEGNLQIDRSSFDAMHGRWVNQRIIIRDGVRRDLPFSIRIYNPTELCTLVRQAGLAIHQLYAGWDGQPLTPDARRIIMVARSVGARSPE